MLAVVRVPAGTKVPAILRRLLLPTLAVTSCRMLLSTGRKKLTAWCNVTPRFLPCGACWVG